MKKKKQQQQYIQTNNFDLMCLSTFVISVANERHNQGDKREYFNADFCYCGLCDVMMIQYVM